MEGSAVGERGSPEKMKAVVFSEPGRYEIREVPVPRLVAPDDVLLEVEAASICGTDLHILAVPPGHPGTVGAILGHEYVGRVVSVGPHVAKLAPGDRVVVDPNLTCGVCPPCQAGLHNMCEGMTTLGIFENGGFAEYNVAPARALYRIPANLPPHLAVFAEPLACVVNACNRVDLRPGESAVVLGAGPIGLYFTQMFRASGAGRILVSEISAFRTRFALESGADSVVDPTKEDLAKAVAGAIPGGPDVVVDAVGNLMAEAVALVRRGGRVLLFGQNTNARPTIAQNAITRKELTVLGSYIARHTFPATVRIIQSGVLKLENLITHRLPIERFAEGLEAMRRGEAIEVVLYPHGID